MEPQLELLHPTDLKPAKYNPRKMENRRLRQLMRSLKEFGMPEPIIINKDGTVIGGHQRLRAATQMGWTERPCIRLDLTPEKERALNVALNKISGSFDVIKLRDLLVELDQEDFDAEIYGYTEEEIAQAHAEATQALDDARQGLGGSQTADKDVERLEPGRMARMGPHALICAWPDDPAAVKALMNVDRGSKADVLVGIPRPTRDMPKRDAPLVDSEVLRAVNTHLKGGGAAYYAADHPHWGSIMGAMGEMAWHFSNVLIWIRDQVRTESRAFPSMHIPLVYGWKEGERHYVRPERNRPDVWNLDSLAVSSDGQTDLVPVALAREILRNSTRIGETVLDLYAGEGHSLEAAHQMGRVARLIEPDPEMCGKIMKRAEKVLQT